MAGLLFAALALFFPTLGKARASDTLPKWVYKIDKLDEAMAEAQKEEKGLAFVYTQPGST